MNIIIHENIIYAYDDRSGYIQIHYLKDKWKTKPPIGSEYFPKNNMLTFAMIGDKIFACYFSDSRLDSFSMKGQKLKTLGNPGCGYPGELDTPIICNTFGDSDILVTDRYNNRLQIYDSKSEKWHIVYLSPSIVQPWGAVMYNGKLYINSYEQETLNMYVKNE